MNDAQGVFETLRRHAVDCSSAWALGTFGVVAEFLRDADEPALVRIDVDVIEVATDRGAMRLTPHTDLQAVAFERPLAQGRTWSQGVALCLPHAASAMNCRTTLTELGPDLEAVRIEDRTAILFDLGLGALQVDACIRVSDPELIAILRAAEGVSVFDPERSPMGAVVRHGPHRVFCGQIGRIEVFQPIPPPDGVSPEGPHTHLLPKLLRTGRTHAATEPIPPGLVPVVHLGPAHPLKTLLGKPRPFDIDAHAAFQSLMADYGDAAHMAVKQRILDAIAAGEAPNDWREPESRPGALSGQPESAGRSEFAQTRESWSVLRSNQISKRFSRAAARVALAQASVLHPESAALSAWRAALGHDETPDEIDEQSQH